MPILGFFMRTLGFQSMATSPVFVGALALFLLNLTVVLLSRLGPTWRRIQLRPRAEKGIRAWTATEAAVVGRKDEVTGQAIAAFVTLRGGVEGNDELLAILRDHVAATIGPIAKPASIVFTDDLPKTRSGKIMRRLLKDISEQRKLGDVTTLANADIVQEIAAKSAAGGDD